MCGRQRTVQGVSAAAPEEVEILDSDPESGTANTTKDIGLSDDDHDSDFEETSSESRFKRTKASKGLETNKQPRPSKRSPDNSASGSPSRRATEATTLDGTGELQQQIGGSSSVIGAGSSSVFTGRASPAGVASSLATVSASSFDFDANTKRRNAFQAGLKAALPDDGISSVTTAGESGSGDAKERETGVGGASSERSGTTPASRGKGKSAASGRVKLTPMEQQVVDLKAKHPGILLLVECGYRYRFFGEDALAAAKVLRIYAHMDHNFQVASVPTFRLAVHLRRLVDAGYKVGVVRQAESAALKAAGLTESGKKSGTFKRELAAVFSQATWVEGAVEALMPASVSGGGGGGGGGGGSGGTGKSAAQGSFKKIGGAWRRVGGWGGKGGEAGGSSPAVGEGNAKEDKEQREEPSTEAEMDAPLPQVDHARSEQWLMSIYEEDASTGAGSRGEPLSISIALKGDDSNGGGDEEIEKVRVGLIAVDVRTGKVVHDTFEEGWGQRQELHTRLRHLRPLELLIPGPRLSKATEATLVRYCESAVDSRGDRRVVRTERLPPEDFCFDIAQASLSKYYGNGCNSAVRGEAGCDVPVLTRVLDLARPAVCALGPLMTHLERFGLDRALASPDLVSFSQSQYMTLDAVTLRDLEVLQCQADGREAGSLFSVLDCTQTAVGRRVLAGWVRQPLLSPEDIRARQDAVEELATDPPGVIERLRPTLRDLKDVDPAIASLHHRRIQPSRLLSLLSTMRKVFAVFHPLAVRATAVKEGARSTVLKEAVRGVPDGLVPVIARFVGELDVTAAASNDYVQALVAGESLCKELAKAGEEEEAAKAGLEKERLVTREVAHLYVEQELQSVRKTLRKPSLQWKTLRTGVTSTVEYLVELRKSEAKKLAPSSWMQVSQTKDLTRFHTPEVLRLQQELLRAKESRNIAARQAWAELVSQVDEECYEGFRSAVHALGTLDALLSLSAVAKLPGYVRPSYHPASEGSGVDEIVLRGARHPTVERVLEGGFVPNDINLRRGECLVVTGPNMGGKSSTVRMAALICIMGQVGSFVPADSAEMYCLDGVFTRMGAGDDLAADMSTFMVELWHTSYIIKHASERSLVVLDELGRGTSTHDGVAIAIATLRHVVRDIGCATLFVTHYPQVADLASDKSLSGGIKNAHMSFIENSTANAEDEPPTTKDVEAPGTCGNARAGSHGVTFLYRLVAGQAHKSYGLNVARAAGMDEQLIDLAAKKSAEMRDRSQKGGP
eukprot:g11936.t1